MKLLQLVLLAPLITSFAVGLEANGSSVRGSPLRATRTSNADDAQDMVLAIDDEPQRDLKRKGKGGKGKGGKGKGKGKVRSPVKQHGRPRSRSTHLLLLLTYTHLLVLLDKPERGRKRQGTRWSQRQPCALPRWTRKRLIQH